jgi:hypothetical protein
MTKCLSCLQCGAVLTPKPHGEPTACYCKPTLVWAWWLDENMGIVKIHVTDPSCRDQAQVLSLHNGVLRQEDPEGHKIAPPAFTDGDGRTIPAGPQQSDLFWRQLHRESNYTPRFPESVQVFGESRYACWAVILKPGTTADTSWATDAELVEKGLRQADAPMATRQIT